MIASGYSMDLYCDNEQRCKFRQIRSWESFSESYIGETFAECAREARKRGWCILRWEGKAYCPQCKGKPQT